MSKIPAKVLTLENELENADECLKRHLNEEYVMPDQQIPRHYLTKSEAIIFLSVKKSISGKLLSNGILLFHLSKNKWSAPCSIFLENTYDITTNNNNNIFNINVSETDYILLIQDSNTLSSFLSMGRMEIKNYGDKYHIYDGPVGRNTVLEKDLKNDDKPLPGILCYAITKNIITKKNSQINPKNHYKWLEEYTLIISKNDNYEYYVNKIDNKYINELDNINNFKDNNIPLPSHDQYYNNIVTLLNDYINSEPNKLVAIAKDKVTKIGEQLLDNTKEHIKQEIKEEGKKEIKYKLFGKPEEEIIQDELYEEHLKEKHDGSKNDTRDVKLLKGAAQRATRLLGSICSTSIEEDNDDINQDKNKNDDVKNHQSEFQNASQNVQQKDD